MQFDSILTGYRKDCSVLLAYASMINSIHNETLNAWSMVLGVGAIASLNMASDNTNIFQWILLFALSIHLPFSFSYHTLTCTKYGYIARELDIAFVVIASSISALSIGARFFGFASWAPWTLFITGLSILFIQFDFLNKQKLVGSSICKRKRFNTFKVVGLAVLIYNIPIFYAFLNAHEKRTYIIIEMSMVVSAGTIYALGYPEKSYPARFDIFGNSHHIAHTLLIIQQVAIWFILV